MTTEREPGTPDDAALIRYSRQLLLPEVDIEGQQRLAAAKVLVVGLGGLGSPVALYLAAAGVGELVLADGDRVELSNLQRQVLYRDADVGQPKALAAARAVGALNPQVTVRPVVARLDAGRLPGLVHDVDLVVDASDNFPTRFAINRACVGHARALVSGAAVRFGGQVCVLHPGAAGAACYQCLFDAEGPAGERCAEAGVLGPVLGVVGAVQATEALKWLLAIGAHEPGWLLRYDALARRWQTSRVVPDPCCPACSA